MSGNFFGHRMCCLSICLRMYMFVCVLVAVVLFEDVHVCMYVGGCCVV